MHTHQEAILRLKAIFYVPAATCSCRQCVVWFVLIYNRFSWFILFLQKYCMQWHLYFFDIAIEISAHNQLDQLLHTIRLGLFKFKLWREIWNLNSFIDSFSNDFTFFLVAFFSFTWLWAPKNWNNSPFYWNDGVRKIYRFQNFVKKYWNSMVRREEIY